MTAVESLLKNPQLTRTLSEEEELSVREKEMSPQSLMLLGCRTDSDLLVKTALERGALVNKRDHESWTPLMHAVYYDSHRVIPRLLRNHAMLHIRDDDGESVFTIARTMGSNDALDELDKALSKSRLKHIGLFIHALETLYKEKGKEEKLRNKSAMALAYIDLGYAWWISEEKIERVFRYFSRAYALSPRTGAFPYASLLAAMGYPDESMTILMLIAKRRWGAVKKTVMEKDEAFYSLRGSEEWKRLMRLW
ncbi:MAG: ankyrin repeat domain-containing protein [Spirochaetales bacterium]|nr:ankyrin repeat domain-containing protein [Spirochaetales bacterium]